jgi:hypothetical protein
VKRAPPSARSEYCTEPPCRSAIRRDEGLEQAPLRGDVDAGAAVLDVHLDDAVLRARAHPHRSLRRRGVHRVLEQVHEHLAELDGIALHVR